MTKQDGGPAFPYGTKETRWLYGNEDVTQGNEPGMSLRDWFAGQALPGIAFDCGLEHSEAAERCYQFADAMLAERAKGGA